MAAVGGLTGLMKAGMAQAAELKPDRPRALKLALASYTTREFNLDQTLEMARRVGFKAICLKSFHLPLEATNAEIAGVAARVKQAGLDLYGCGVVAMPNEKAVNRAFEYAKTAGMSHIIGTPAPEVLPLVDRKVKEYNIAVAIHNHGPGDDTYPMPDVAYERIKLLDQRVGLCHDIGHTVRVGKDPAALTRQCADRLLDVHFKDVTAATARGHSAPCGRGVMDLPAVLRALLEIGFSGHVAFEYEEEADDPLPGLAESVGYVRGVLDALG